MSGLPRAKDTTRQKDAFTLLILDGVERMTTSLRRGDPFSAKGLDEMQALQRRLKAFSDALEARVSALEKVIDDD